ncbi:MAG: carboxypeptidase-like regulatory domain-containing protein, partial [Planctomycetota bacterium]
PVGTVKVQLERGRERLRARLADEFGPGGPLALALLPLAAPGRGAVAAAAAVPASVGLPLLAGARLLKIPTLLAAVTRVLACAWGVKELVPTNDRRDAPAALERSDAELAATGAPVTSAPLIAAVGESATARVAPNEAGDSPTEAPGTPTGAAWIRGRALLVDGTPLTGIYVYAYGPVDQTVVVDEIGSFAFEGLEAGEYEVRLSWRGDQLAPEGAQNATSVRAMAPTEDIEFQLDGLLVELHLGERMEGRPIKGLTVETYGHPAIRFMSTGGAGTMGNAVLELVPAGPGYLFKGTLDDERDVVGHLAPGLRSGRYRVEMSYSAPGLGAIEGKLTGGTIEHPDRITVWIDPLAEAFDDAPPRSSPALRLRTQEPARNDGILPGKYAVRAKASDLPPFEYWVPVPRPSEIEVSEGDVTSIDVELIRGGNVMVKIDVEPTENDSNPELQRWNPSAETWERLDVMHRVGENFQWGLNISNGVEAWSADALPIGPVRLRLVGEGWETQETTLEILASEMARWHPRLQRTD